MGKFRLLSISEMPRLLLKYENKKVEILFSCCVRNSKGERYNMAGHYYRLGIKEVLEIQSLPKPSAERGQATSGNVSY